MSDVKWTKAQELSIEHTGSDLIISAAAGSGKSATLTERIIRKIKGGGDISKMLIVTFTKAATGELKSKISSSLGKSLKENPSDAHIQKQLVRVGSAEICTIDSFCMRLVKPNFDKLMIDADFRIGDTSEITILERETMNEIIDELYECEERDKDFLLVVDCYSNIWNEDLLGKSLLDLRKKLLSTSNGLETLLKFDSCPKNFLESDYGAVLKRYIQEGTYYFLPIYEDALKDIKGDSKGKAYIDIFAKENDYLIRLKKALDNNKSYDELKEIVSDIDFLRMPSSRLANQEIPLAFYKDARAHFKDFATKLKDELFTSTEGAIKSTLKQNVVICKAIYNILKKFEEALFKKKKLFSVYSFDDISNFALSLLYDKDGNISELAKNIASKYDEIYIDEYQDTNSVQDKIFKAISKNNRFMVGDIKQSIYRFRSAEPEIFSYYRTHFDKKDCYTKKSLGLSVFMSNNFRCDKSIIDFSNLISNYMFLNSTGIPYESSDQLIYSKNLPDEYKHSVCEISLINSDGLGRNNGPKYEAEYVAKRIKSMIENEYLPNGKKIKPSHIAILLRNYSSNHELYKDALERYGINSRYETAEDFFEKPHVMLFNCILNSIDNPSRDIYLAGAMRSYVFGFTLDELVKIKKEASSSSSLYSALKSYDKDASLKEKIGEFLNRLKEIKSAIKKMTAYEAISYIFGRCGIISMCNSEEKEDLTRLYNLAREYESSSYKGLYSFLKHIERISDSKGDKSFKGDSSKENVRIMTIHSSKGLEFEICFICNLADTFNNSDTGGPILFQRQLGIAGYVGKEDGLTKFKTMARKCIALQLSRDMRDEEMRILYVAMTRARSKLILTASTSSPKKHLDIMRDGKKYVTPYVLYTASSLYKFVFGGICEPHTSFDINYIDANNLLGDTKVSETTTSYDSNKVKEYKEILDKRISFKYRHSYLEKLPSKMSISKLYPQILDGEHNDDIDIKPLKEIPSFLSYEDENVKSNERGTATHVFMQFCDFNKLIENGVDMELQRLKNCSFISEKDAKIVNTEHLNMFLRSDLLKEFLKSKKIIREFRFNVMLDASEFTENEDLKNEKVLVQGVTDCIYENQHGELILVDYKTDNVSLENYQKILTERHSTQLLYYKKACELMFEKPVSKVLIYSVPLAKTVEIQ